MPNQPVERLERHNPEAFRAVLLRLRSPPKQHPGDDEDALAEFGEDLEHDSENGVLSADEQDKLVITSLAI